MGTEGRAAGMGLDNSSGNVNKQHFVKRSCTEAMLKVNKAAQLGCDGVVPLSHVAVVHGSGMVVSIGRVSSLL